MLILLPSLYELVGDWKLGYRGHSIGRAPFRVGSYGVQPPLGNNEWSTKRYASKILGAKPFTLKFSDNALPGSLPQIIDLKF